MMPFHKSRGFRIRVAIVGVMIALFGFFVLARAYELQIVDHEKYRTAADNQSLRKLRLSPLRGSIVDRNGAELAVSVPVDSIYADPRYFKSEGGDPAKAARLLAELLEVSEETIERRLASDRRFVWLERRVLPEVAREVRALKLPGVLSVEEMRRYYPNRSLAAHILGFANIDGVGIEGLELAYDEQLRGMIREIPAIRDARGRTVYSDLLIDRAPHAGHDLELSIDRTIQDIVETELALGVANFEAKSGSVVVVEPRTGELLALANFPTYNPNAPSGAVSARRNRAVTDRFEPGSTVKVFTVAAAIDEGTIDPEDEFDCERGVMQVGEDDVIRETSIHSMLSVTKILAYSSNIGTAKIGMTLGREGLYRAFRRFGFGTETGLGLPGETAGRLSHFGRWYELDAVTISFGQGFSSNAVQLAYAMAAVANGGVLMEPLLVRSVRDELGQVVEEFLPRVKRRVISEETAELMGEMLTSVTGRTGTAEDGGFRGLLVGGKNGTGQEAGGRGLGYAKDRYIASFVGYVPADDPALVIAVILDEPIVAYYGGVAAGPIFRRIADASLRYMGALPHDAGSALDRVARAERQRQEQAPAAQLLFDEVDAVTADEAPILGAREVLVPDLRGLTARAALRRATAEGLTLELSGTGEVIEQYPAPSTIVHRESTLRIKLGEPSAPSDEEEGA